MDSFTRQSEPTSLLEVHLYLQTMIKEGRRELMFLTGLFLLIVEIIMCWQRKCGSKYLSGHLTIAPVLAEPLFLSTVHPPISTVCVVSS